MSDGVLGAPRWSGKRMWTPSSGTDGCCGPGEEAMVCDADVDGHPVQADVWGAAPASTTKVATIEWMRTIMSIMWGGEWLRVHPGYLLCPSVDHVEYCILVETSPTNSTASTSCETVAATMQAPRIPSCRWPRGPPLKSMVPPSSGWCRCRRSASALRRSGGPLRWESASLGEAFVDGVRRKMGFEWMMSLERICSHLHGC